MMNTMRIRQNLTLLKSAFAENVIPFPYRILLYSALIKMVKESKSIMIEAKLRGPGPGRYGLPATCGQTGHDFSKHMKPAFSFGGQLPLKNNVR